MFIPKVKFSHLKTASKSTWKDISSFFAYLWLVLVVIFNWSKEFSPIGKTYSFFIPKLVVIFVGALITGIPFLLLVPIAFLPVGLVVPVFFVAFVAMFRN
jgi:hypothetical protein